MILGIGVDLTRISRFKAILVKSSSYSLRFAKRILSQSEMQEFHDNLAGGHDAEQMAKFLAVRWSVKEATYKALYPHSVVTWKQISLAKSSGCPKPELLLADDINSELRISKSHLSISHDGDYVIAQVLFTNN